MDTILQGLQKQNTPNIAKELRKFIVVYNKEAVNIGECGEAHRGAQGWSDPTSDRRILPEAW